MNKKIQYQVSKIQSNILQYNNILEKLNLEKLNLENKLITTKDEKLPINNIVEHRNKLASLEAQGKSIKQNISDNTKEISIANNLLLNTITIRENKIKDEEQIYKDELLRIEAETIDNNIKYNEELLKAHLDKASLLDNIQFVESELYLQNKIIVELQTISHTSRKETLELLQQKKQDKLNTLQHINNNKEIENEFTNQIVSLEANIQKLINLKTLIIDIEYNVNSDSNSGSNSNTDSNTDSNTLYNEFNIDVNIPITDKILLIDKQINDYQNKLTIINNKFNKSKITNTARIQNILNTYNTTNRTKILGYKDKYKIEKEKKNELETILAIMKNKYDTYEDIIINSIKNKLDNSINELENDRENSLDRMNIMNIRILDEFNSENLRINNIISYHKNQLQVLKNSFDLNMKNISDIKLVIEVEDSINCELDRVNEQIKIYMSNIKQSESEIINLYNV